MSPRLFTPRVLRAATTPFRAYYNSSAASSRRNAARVIQLAAERPSTRELSTPLLWLLTGGLAAHAFSRIEGTKEQVADLEKLLIV